MGLPLLPCDGTGESVRQILGKVPLTVDVKGGKMSFSTQWDYPSGRP